MVRNEPKQIMLHDYHLFPTRVWSMTFFLHFLQAISVSSIQCKRVLNAVFLISWIDSIILHSFSFCYFPSILIFYLFKSVYIVPMKMSAMLQQQYLPTMNMSSKKTLKDTHNQIISRQQFIILSTKCSSTSPY